MVGLGDLPGGFFRSRAFGVSADGCMVVGSSSSGSGNEAFRWTCATGMMVGLGDLPGGIFESGANDVSADGLVVVGDATSASGIEAFRWTQATGMVGLGDLPGGGFTSQARAVCSDGSVVVGDATSASGIEAFIWDPVHGMRSLRTVLINDFGLGSALTGWTLTTARGISADCLTIAGYGTNPSGQTEAWTADMTPTLTLSPSSGKYVTTQAFDLVGILEGLADRTVVGGTALLDGVDKTAEFQQFCLPGTLSDGGQTYRCHGLTGAILGLGFYTVNVCLLLSDSAEICDTVTWEVLENTEP